MSHHHHHHQPQSQSTAGISKPHRHDVLLGRGGAANHHHGNAVFRSVVAKTRPLYRQVPKHQKIIVARSIVHAVSRQDPPGRFLERRRAAKAQKGGGTKGKGGEDKLWYEVPFERAVEKAKQALRERGRDEDDGTDDDNDEGGGRGPAAAATGAGTALGRPPAAAGSTSSRIQQLSTADEAVAARYRHMLQFGVAPSVVRGKMETERVAPRIVQSVLSGGGGSGAGGGGSGGFAQLQQPQPAQPQRHVQFASGTNTPTHGHGHGSFRLVPAKRRVSSVLLSMLGLGGDDDAPDGNEGGTGGARPTGLPQEVLDVIEEITPEGDDHTGPAAAAAVAAAAAMASPPSQGGGGNDGGPAASSSQRRRSSIFNLFRRQSRSVGGGALTYAQRACTSLTYDAEGHRKLLVELKADGVDVDGEGDGGDGGGGSGGGGDGDSAGGQGASRRSDTEKGQQRKRKASSSVAVTSPGKGRASLSIVRQRQQQSIGQQQQKARPTSIAEAAALVAAETELEEMEPEDVHAQPKRISFSPALFGNLFGSFSAGTVDGAGNPVEAPGTTTTAQAAAAAAASSSAGGHFADAPSSPGLLRQSTSAARRSLVATMNLFQQATGKDDPLADTNRSEGSYVDGEGGASGEPTAKRRRRSTWLSGLRFSTMPAAVESATSAVAAAQAVQGMGLVKDDDDDDDEDDSIAQKPAAVDDGL